MKAEGLSIKGFQTPLLVQANQFRQCAAPMLQILHEKGREHWMCVFSEHDSCVYVYDSLNAEILTETVENLCRIVPPSQESTVTVRLMNAQRQRNSTDCGIYACDFMERLARGEQVDGVTFDSAQLRPHFISCLRDKKVTPFPVLRVTYAFRKGVLKQIFVDLVCVCHKPWMGELVVECSGCNKYFHPNCLHGTRMHQLITTFLQFPMQCTW